MAQGVMEKMLDIEFLAVAGMAEKELREQEAMPYYTIVGKTGKTVRVQEQTAWLYSNGRVYYRDAKDCLYCTYHGDTEVCICEPSGEPSHVVGRLVNDGIRKEERSHAKD